MAHARAEVHGSFEEVLGKASGFLGGIVVAVLIVIALIVFTNVEETGFFHKWMHNQKLKIYSAPFLEKNVLSIVADEIGRKVSDFVNGPHYKMEIKRNAT